MVDYRELLKKYIEHIVGCEGTDFIGTYIDDYFDFTKEEVHILNDLSNELKAEYKERHG